MNIFQKITSQDGLKVLWEGALKLHIRFPMTILSSLAGTSMLIYFIENYQNSDHLVALIFAFIMGVPLMFSAEMFNERLSAKKWISVLVVGLFLAFYFYTTPFKVNMEESPMFFIRTAALLVVAHLLVSFAPYFRLGSTASFWQYNKTLFLAILTAFLYSGTLAAGLNLALLAIVKLFDLHIEESTYAKVFVFINGYINTLLFLSNVKTLPEIDVQTDYPKGLKYFTQYVLLPLVAIYVLILLAYEGKIIVNQSLPRGWVSYLVLVSGIFGILAFLLIYPLKTLHLWIAKFTKGYYLVLIPLAMLMIVAIYTRINEYGITEPRFLVAILAVWLLGMAIYFGFMPQSNIKVIPMSLAVVGLVSIYGPLSCFDVSLRNQKHRLETALAKNQLIKNGKITAITAQKISIEDQRKLMAAYEHISNRDIDYLSGYFSKADFDRIKTAERWQRQKVISEITGVSQQIVENERRIVVSRENNFKKLYKADYAINVGSYDNQNTTTINTHKIVTDGTEITKLTVTIDGQKMVFDLQPFMKIKSDVVDREELTLVQENEKWKVTLALTSINFDENAKIDNFSGEIYLTEKTK